MRRLSFILGGPCSGKGYFARKLCEYGAGRIYGISAGDLIRKEVERKGKNHELIEEILLKGQIIPAAITTDLLLAEISAASATHPGLRHFLVDGFPRNQENYEEYMKRRASFPELHSVFHVECSLDTMRKRLSSRSQEEKRSDDKEAIFQRRLEVFQRDTVPVIDAFRLAKVPVKRIQSDTAASEYEALISKIAKTLA